MIRLALVLPCYNEQEVLRDTNRQLLELYASLKKETLISDDSYILYVNDGSKDGTWNIIEELHRENSLVKGLDLAANVGHQNALLAGLMQVKDECDAAISLDADLQDDIGVIGQMIQCYEKGNEIVYGVRDNRDTDSFFKRNSALMFYKLMRACGVKSVYNHADFRLMSSKALNALEQYEERNLFLRGIVPLLGYTTTNVYYSRKKRMAGESKYPFKKMVHFALDGITSFTVKPISIITGLGVLTILIAIVLTIYSLVRHFAGFTVGGWTSLMVSLWFIGGVQLVSVGVIGQYIGKIYTEVKKRPRYNVDKFLTDEEEKDDSKNS